MSKTFALRDGDIIIDSSGSAVVIEGYNKVQQDINHVLSHPYDSETDYGNELLINQVNVVERSAIPGLVQRDIGSALARLRRFQGLIPRRYMPDNERIERVRSITVRSIGNLGVAFVATVSVASRSAEDLSTVFRIKNDHISR